MNYADQDILTSTEIMVMPYVPWTQVGGVPVVHIPQDWTCGSNISGLLVLIKMPHFGWSTYENACAKQLSACFHGRISWLDRSLTVTVALISDITVLPKEGPVPS